jgi:ankyrin repeat protein
MLHSSSTEALALLHHLQQWLNTRPWVTAQESEPQQQISLNTQLFSNILFGNESEIAMLLQYGANPNAQNQQGITALQFALLHAPQSPIPLLLQDFGAKPSGSGAAPRPKF